MAQGQFITLEGGEGVGKSTLARGLQSALSARAEIVLCSLRFQAHFKLPLAFAKVFNCIFLMKES